MWKPLTKEEKILGIKVLMGSFLLLLNVVMFGNIIYIGTASGWGICSPKYVSELENSLQSISNKSNPISLKKCVRKRDFSINIEIAYCHYSGEFSYSSKDSVSVDFLIKQGAYFLACKYPEINANLCQKLQMEDYYVVRPLERKSVLIFEANKTVMVIEKW